MHQNLDRIVSLFRAGRIKYVLFDLDGTLYESSAGIEAQLRGAMVTQAAFFLGMSKKEAHHVLASYRRQYKASVLGLKEYHGIDPVAFYEAVYGSLDVSAMRQRPGCIEALESLAQIVPIGVFTNSNRRFTAQTLDFLGISSFFERVVTVEDHGFIRKPEVEAYNMLFDSLDLPPEEVVMFDDIASSLEVMSDMGSHGVLVGNGLRPYPGFVDLHTDIEYDRAPPYVLAATHDIVGFVSGVSNALLT